MLRVQGLIGAIEIAAALALIVSAWSAWRLRGFEALVVARRRVGAWAGAFGLLGQAAPWFCTQLALLAALLGLRALYFAGGYLVGAVCWWVWIAPRLRSEAGEALSLPVALGGNANRDWRRVMALMCLLAALAAAFALGYVLDLLLPEGDPLRLPMLLGSVGVAVLVAMAGLRAVLVLSAVIGVVVLSVSVMLAAASWLFAGGADGLLAGLRSWDESFVSLRVGSGAEVVSLALAAIGVAAGVVAQTVSTQQSLAMATTRKARQAGIGAVLLLCVLAAASCVCGIGLRVLWVVPEQGALPLLIAASNVMPPGAAGVVGALHLAMMVVALAGALLAAAAAWAAESGAQQAARLRWLIAAGGVLAAALVFALLNVSLAPFAFRLGGLCAGVSAASLAAVALRHRSAAIRFRAAPRGVDALRSRSCSAACRAARL